MCFNFQNTFAPISYTQLEEEQKDKLDNDINESEMLPTDDMPNLNTLHKIQI